MVQGPPGMPGRNGEPGIEGGEVYVVMSFYMSMGCEPKLTHETPVYRNNTSLIPRQSGYETI